MSQKRDQAPRTASRHPRNAKKTLLAVKTGVRAGVCPGCQEQHNETLLRM